MVNQYCVEQKPKYLPKSEKIRSSNNENVVELGMDLVGSGLLVRIPVLGPMSLTQMP